MFIKLACKSLLNRKHSVLLTILSMSISIFVLLGVEHIRHQAKESFASTVSGVDLIVGARTGQLNLLLYSVFHTGSPSNNIGWDTFNNISENPSVAWAVPLSLGDSHRGYRVVGTSPEFFEHYHYGANKKLSFEQGRAFDSVFGAVLGFDVARKLGYQLNDEIIVAHGIAESSFLKHDRFPFRVVGILEKTGTPVDMALHVSLQGIEAIHTDSSAQEIQIDKKLEDSLLTPKSITAALIGLKSKIATFKVQRYINQYRQEPLTSILPGVALMELWQMMAMLENILRLISGFVLIASLLGLSAMLLASIRERNPEIRLLRIIGASPLYLFLLIELEAILISLVSILAGVGSLYICFTIAGELLASHFGFHVNSNIFTQETFSILLWVIILTSLSSLLPALIGYRKARN